MKELIRFTSIILGLAFAVLIIHIQINKTEVKADSQIVHVYNWGEYIDPELIKEFEQESGYKVQYEVFDSNEAMYTKVKSNAGAYDVVVPSEYMVDKMMKEKLLYPLNKEEIPNIKYVDENYLKPTFDPENTYSVPYFWGTVGIIYNTKLTDLKFNSWNDLWDPSLKNQVFLVDGAREVMGMALNSLGYSLNTDDKVQLKLAQQKLFELKPNVKAIIGDEVLMLMPSGEASAAVTWSGSAADMIAENDDLNYVVPKEGSNIWLDNMVIPKTSKNQKGANAFINFMLKPESMAKNAEYVGYSTALKNPEKYLDKEIVDDKRFYPDQKMLDKLEYYQNLSKDLLQYYNDLFLEFKMF